MGNTALKEVNYAVPIENEDKRDDETYIYRAPESVGKDLNMYGEEFNTLHNLYKQYFNYKPDDKAFGRRLLNDDGTLQDEFTWITKQDLRDTCEELGSGMLNMHLFNSNKEWRKFEMKMIAVYSNNNLPYYITDIAMAMQGITCVPIYDTLGEEAIQFIFNQTKLTTCFLTANHVEKIIDFNKDKKNFKYLKNLVVLDPENFNQSMAENNKGKFRIIMFDEVREEGKRDMRQWADINPETAYCISYTSGTTGQPKGAVLSHRNLISVLNILETRSPIGENDYHLSYLPLAHIFERAVYNMCMAKHTKIAVFNGNVLKLKEDLAILKPTFFISVPRLFNKFHDKIWEGINAAQGIKRKLVDMAIATKLDNLEKKCKYNHWFYDAIVFKKMRMVLGGRVRFMITASAPISLEVLKFLKIAFSCPILEAYGQTEGTGAEFCTFDYDPLGGHVGGPSSQNEFKLVDVPEMQYTNRDVDSQGRHAPRGEIWVRGPNIIPGYFLNEPKNKETFTKDGWLQSGDIGQILADGQRLKIIDRKKNIFKLSQGEYIAPEKLEGAYKIANPLITDVFVYGDSLKSCLIGFVSIEMVSIVPLAKELGIEGEAETLAENPEFVEALRQLFIKEANKQKFNKLEQLKMIKIETTPWAELDLLTTTFKKKRNVMRDHYSKEIEEMYAHLY